MRIQTFSICLPSGCDAACPFCVSRQTGLQKDTINSRHLNFLKGCRMAEMLETTTVVITGKGEPCLYPELIDYYLDGMKPFNFPFHKIFFL